LGSRICKSAVARGWNVVSLSRSGEPTWSSITSSPIAPEWSKEVTWQKSNILHPTEYQDALKGANTVVHSMGILLEADYKGIVQGKEPIMAGLQKLYSSTRGGASANPLDESPGKDAKPAESGTGQLTYELMNRDSAILLARESYANKVPTFVYISAAAGAPILPARYISTKRAAESTISKHFPSMRSVMMRPSFLYDSSRSFTLPIAAAGKIASLADFGGLLSKVLGAGAMKPLLADAVADAVIEAAEDSTVHGPVELQQIEALAQKAWRKGML